MISWCILLYILIGIVFTTLVCKYGTDDGFIHVDEMLLSIFFFWYIAMWYAWEWLKEWFE